MDISLCHGFEKDPDSVSDAMKSFPSGHAQMSCFAAAFIIVSFVCLKLFVFTYLWQVYLSGRLDTTQSHLAKYWLQLLLVVMAIFSSTTRISDHRHHAVDVVVGAAIGIVLGVTAALGIVFPTYQDMEMEKQEGKVKQKRTSKTQLINSELGLG